MNLFKCAFLHGGGVTGGVRGLQATDNNIEVSWFRSSLSLMIHLQIYKHYN